MEAETEVEVVAGGRAEAGRHRTEQGRDCMGEGRDGGGTGVGDGSEDNEDHRRIAGIGVRTKGAEKTYGAMNEGEMRAMGSEGQ